MEVILKRPSGCVLAVGTLFSFGLNLLLLRSVEGKVPKELTESEIILRNGKRYDWAGFQQLKMTDVYVNRRFIGTRIDLKHERGKLRFGTDKMQNAKEVMEYLYAHLPADVVATAKPVKGYD